jgi:DNA (cytosine-5)-methyltransferase 1
MGYKLAGFDLVGCVEIDPQMLRIYEKNLSPRVKFNMPIQKFNEIQESDIPEELMHLDVLDGSPPCSVFSMAGSREEKWGKAHAFREGQAVQRLDDLFFHFIETARRLKPKVVVAENVKGMLAGNAKGYVREIVKNFQDIGYSCQVFLLNASRMGVCQRRERVFFLANRMGFKPIKLNFESPTIPVEGVLGKELGDELSEAYKAWWRKTPPGKSFSYSHPKGSFFNSYKLHPKLPSLTVTATGGAVISRWDTPHKISDRDVQRIQSFPEDYDFLDQNAKYICGMSVPPYMMRAIATQIKLQWLS